MDERTTEEQSPESQVDPAELDAWLWRVVWARENHGDPEPAPGEEPDHIGALDHYWTPGNPDIQVRHSWTMDVAPELAAGRTVYALLAHGQHQPFPVQTIKVPKDARPVCFYRRGRTINPNTQEELAPPPSILCIGWQSKRAKPESKRGVWLFLLHDGSTILTHDRDAVEVHA